MINNNPKISIILPVFNTEKYISECIKSILNQTYSNFELIICDDCSIDNSVNIINSFDDKRITVKLNNENLGKIMTVNNILPSLRGKYFSVHDADDISEKERFEKQVNLLENNPELAICGCSFNEIDKKGEILRNVEMPTNINEIRKTQSFPETSNFHGPTLLIRYSILEKVGGFYRAHFKKGEDVEFCSRVCEKYEATNINEELYRYRLLDTSLTKSVDAYDYKNIAHIEFGKYIQKIRRETGNDLYTSLNLKDLNIMFEKYLLNAREKQLEYYKYGINRSIYFKYFKNAFILNFKWIRSKPYDFEAYKYLISTSIKFINRQKSD